MYTIIINDEELKDFIIFISMSECSQIGTVVKNESLYLCTKIDQNQFCNLGVKTYQSIFSIYSISKDRVKKLAKPTRNKLISPKKHKMKLCKTIYLTQMLIFICKRNPKI